VVRRSRLNTPVLQQRFEIEVHIFQQLTHHGIVHLYDLIKDRLNYYIFMEYCPNGELFRLMRDRGPLTEAQSRFVIREIFDALDYCHQQGIAHRDLKPENLLLSATGHVKLSDFGLSKYVGSSGLCGTPCYASPECLSGEQYNAMASDIWSVGVILYALVSGRLPWTTTNQTKLFAQVRRGEYELPKEASPHCQDFIRRLLTVDAARRMSIADAYRHEWLATDPRPRVRQEEGGPWPWVGVKKADQMFESEEDGLPPLPRTASGQPAAFERVVKAIRRDERTGEPREAAAAAVKAAPVKRAGTGGRNAVRIRKWAPASEKFTTSRPAGGVGAASGGGRGGTTRRGASVALRPR
jgi:serine/threonine protein kinase